MEQMVKQLMNNEKIHKITLPYSKGYKVVDINDILMFKGNNNYSDIYLVDGSMLLSSKTLRFFELNLPAHRFFRIHKSFLINLLHIQEINLKDGGYVTLLNDQIVPVARGKSTELMQLINGIDME